MPASYPPIVARLRELGPFADDGAAWRSLAATLRTLAAFLTPEERKQLGGALPAQLAELLRVRVQRLEYAEPDELFRRVAASEGAHLALAVEHAQVACRALGEDLTPALRGLLARAVPELAPLFEPPAEPEAPLADEPNPDAPHDLAEGRPGSTHPLASSDPSQLAHRHSVARSDDPHADTKLSSSGGTTQEREGRTLSRGRPGSKRPLSRSH